MSAKEIMSLVVEAQNILSLLENNKGLYRRLDEITILLHGVDLSRFGLVITDNFSGGNVAFKATGIRRFELKKIA